MPKTMPKVVFFTHLVPELAGLLTAHAPADFDVFVYPAKTPDSEKAALVADADFLIPFPGVIAEPVLRAARRLRLVQLVSAGFDRMDLDLCRSLGVPVANNGGTNSIDVSEHTLSLILGLYRLLPAMDRTVRAGRWNALDSGALTYTIHGKTAGIVGFGNIGRQIARLLRPFGATLPYFDVQPAPPAVEAELGVQRAALEDLLQRADIVTLHVPLNSYTDRLIGARELELMKPNALLINTCRGPVVDEPALAEALAARRIAGAGLDVLVEEPPSPDNPLFHLDNVLLTPHTAGVTRDTWSRRGEFIFANLQRVWQDQAPLAAV
jgi:phosphoglycerate dehydrogenase-like enzyme